MIFTPPTSAASSGFVELARSFHDISQQQDDNGDADSSRLFPMAGHLGWRELLQEYRLIILSEAGSGKTEEIRNIAVGLRRDGKAAFFVRLEHVAGDFEDAFEVGTGEEFESWLASSEEGWLLLDSIDEARLRSPADFELAIRKLGRRISKAKDRVHVVITGRTTAWRPKNDLDCCVTHLPRTAVLSAVQPEDAESASRRTKIIAAADKAEQRPLFRLVALDDLNAEQIALFATARGIPDPKAFLDAIQRADAWSFTARPQDLAELTDFWLDTGCIGSRLEIMRNSIERRLAERDQDRADAHPLSAERAREGARLLAAAATLMRTQVLRVPDGADNTRGLDVRTVLADWDDSQQAALLSRPIFDEAIYGTVRFHHRSVREYLAAEWFAGLLARQASRRNVERLFFGEQYGIDVVIPALRPILPWLVILDEKMREHTRRIAPEIILEGGDPSQLPLEVRRFILHEICEQMAGGATGRSARDYAAVQRFASPDLADDIKLLMQKHAADAELASFLLRMVWIGQLKEVRQEALDIALIPEAEHYLRITAFRAVGASGTMEDRELVRQRFLAEADTLDRDWLGELVDGLEPSAANMTWLIACLAKSSEKPRHAVDHLGSRIEGFFGAVDLSLLPRLLCDLNNLLDRPPVIERRHCEISSRFQWLSGSAAGALKRLIEARHPAALGADALDLLQKLCALRGYGLDEFREVREKLEELVPAWPELNRTLFWFEVAASRKRLDSGRDLTEFWEVAIFGTFVKFSPSDFDYVAEQIRQQPLPDDRLLALSLAFHLYRLAERPRRWRERLKKVTAGDTLLSGRLSGYLNPPAQAAQHRRWKQQQSKWRRRSAAREAKTAKYHAEWKDYLDSNLDKIRADQTRQPGKFTGALYYLHGRTRGEGVHTGRWTEYNWRSLIPDYGEDAARFFRDGAVALWRHHKPRLHSEGAPLNETPDLTICGLAGLEIESIEAGSSWAAGLSAADVEMACRHAAWELNGFPLWFPRLFEAHADAVTDFLAREIRYELAHEHPEQRGLYILHDVSWSGEWAWNALAPHVLVWLRESEPGNLENLDALLGILQGSSVADVELEVLAAGKCRTLKDIPHLARWYTVWTGVAPESAIAALRACLHKLPDSPHQVELAMTFVTRLWRGRHSGNSSIRPGFQAPRHLKALYLLMHEHVKIQEDLNRAGTGVYSPTLRDDAQDARNTLFNLLNKIPGKEAFLAVMEIAVAHPEPSLRPWMLHHAKMKAEQDADSELWTAAQVRDFAEKLERTPATHRELAELARLRLLDIRDDVENGDSSITSILRGVTQETDMRKFIGRELREKANGRYVIPQEEELADAKRPDLRFHGVGFDGPVPVELKLADKWTGPALFERLENQLCGDYLRDNRSSHGLFVLVYGGGKAGWDIPAEENRVDFQGLLQALRNHWTAISASFPTIDAIEVVGIDLTSRGGFQPSGGGRRRV